MNSRPFAATLLAWFSFHLCISAAPAPTMTIGQNFTGTSYGSTTTNSGAIPADGNGAVGPGYFVEFVNGVFAIYNKTNGSHVDFKTDVDFWAAAGVALDAFSEVSDPRVIYDPISQRWFACQVDIDIFTQILDDMLGSNHFLLAVSSTANPRDPWKGVIFDSDPSGDTFADFPTLGVDSQGVYLAADMYDATASPSDPTVTDLGQGLVSIPKADMLAATPSADNRTWFGVLDNSGNGQVLQPAFCPDGSFVGGVLATGDIGSTSDPHSNLVSFAIQNATNAAGATLGPAHFITVNPYVVPDNAAVGGPLLTASQPDGTSTLQANDARFSAKVYAVGGVLYGVHNTELNLHLAIRWYRIRASDGVLLESGTIADPNLDYYYPSIAANSAGTIVIGFNASGLTTYISSFAVAGQTVNGITTFGTPLLLKSEAINYHGDDETGEGGLADPAPTSRWGDYSATSVDPSDPNRFWTIQMFPSDTNVWTTAITELITVQQVALTIAKAGTNVNISWPLAATGYQLQSATNLTASTSWSNFSQTPQTNGTQLFVQLPASAKRQFFRLKK